MKDDTAVNGKPGRIFCVDLLRGLDIFFLLVVSYGLLHAGFFKVWPLQSLAGKVFWSHSLTAFAAAGQVPTGFGIQDFTQPLFIFITGVSASLAMRKFVRADDIDLGAFARRLVSRTLMLWTLGSLIRGVLEFKLFTGSQPSFVFYSDTLHTIALAYFSASVGLLLRRPWLRFAAGLSLIVISAVIMAICGDYTQHGNAARLFEEWVFSRLGGKAKDFCYLMTTLPWAGMGILASLAGDVLKTDRAPWSRVRVLAAAGLAAFAVGKVLTIWVPAIRYIYTISFVFETQGLALLLLAALYVLTDIWGWRRGTWVLVLFGQCSLAAWMMMNFFGVSLTAAADRIVAGVPKLLGPENLKYKPLVHAIVRMSILIWAVWAWRLLREAKAARRKGQKLV